MSNELVSRKRVLALIFSVVAIGSLIGGVSVYGNMQTNRDFEEAIEQAREFSDQDNFDSALKELDQALTIKPDEFAFVNQQRNQIKSLQTSQKALADAQGFIQESNYVDAMKALQTIYTDQRGLLTQATDLKKQIRPEIVEATEKEVKNLVNAKKYQDAINLIVSTNEYIGSPRILETELSSIKSALELKIRTERKAALAKLRSRYDSFQDVTWYQSFSSPNYRNTNGFYLYFGMSDGEKLPLRLVVQYYDDDWLFIQRARVNVDGRVYELSASEWKRDNNSNIWEWSDERLGDREMIEKIIRSRSAVIRFDGRQYYDTRTISSTQKAAMKTVLDAWDLQR